MQPSVIGYFMNCSMTTVDGDIPSDVVTITVKRLVAEVVFDTAS